MNERQRLFLVQARANHALFGVLRKEETLGRCHALYALQMATELLGKAHASRAGPVELSHRAFVPFLRTLSNNPKARDQLGYKGKNANWRHLLRKCEPLAEQIQKLAPSLAGDGPNAEYPWPKFPQEPTDAPAEFDFPLWHDLTETALGHQFLQLLDRLFGVAEAYM
ncbi:MAG: hypothetical protein K2V38_01180 [Gemmataceae bacterium]|nr:hypothetical protein [Gemmataceae bacterium]